MPPRPKPGGTKVSAPILEANFLKDGPEDPLSKVWDLGDWRTKLEYGREYARRGVSDTALTLLVDVLNVVRSGAPYGPVSLATLLQLIAELYVHQENYDKAYELYSEALGKLRERLPEDHLMLGYTLVHLGDVEFRREKIDEALKLYEEALALMRKQAQPDHKLLGIATHSLAGVHRKKEDFDLAEVLYRDADEMKGRREPPTAPTRRWTEGALVELKELRDKKEQERARGAPAQVNPTAALLKPREPVKEIDPILAYPEYGVRADARGLWEDVRGRFDRDAGPPGEPMDVVPAQGRAAKPGLLIHESGSVPMALALTSDRAHVDSQGKASHRLVLTYGLEKYLMELEGGETPFYYAVYKFIPRKLDTYISNTGPEVKRLVASVWVKMFATYRVYSLMPSMPKLIVYGKWNGVGWERSLSWEGLDPEAYKFELRPREELPWLFRYATPLANVFRLKGAAPWDCPSPEAYLVWELNRVLPEGVPLDVLESLDVETVQAGLQMLRRDPSETDEPEHYVPRKHLMGLVLPRLEEAPFRFFLCHGNDEAVHVADLCKFLWWIAPWAACGQTEEKLRLLYKSLSAEDFSRLLVTHNPGPILKSRVSLPAGTCVATISSSVAAVVVLHVLEANKECIAIRVLPVFLWGPSDRPEKLVFVGGEPGFYSPLPQLIYAKPKTQAEACRLFGAHSESLVRQLMDAEIFNAAGGPLDDGAELKPMKGLDEIIASAELRRRPNRRAATERGEVPSDPALLTRGARPYSQDGSEDEFDEELRAGYIPDYLRCRRVVGERKPMPSTEAPTAEQPWVIHLGRPFSRTKLGHRTNFLVMVEVWREALQRPNAVDWASVSVRLREEGEGQPYFKPAEAAWRSLVLLDESNAQKVEVLPLVALEARVVDDVNLEPDPRVRAARPKAGQPTLQQLWERLPREVTVEVLRSVGKGKDREVISSAKFELNPLDFTGDFVGDPRSRFKDDTPDAWALVLVGKDAVAKGPGAAEVLSRSGGGGGGVEAMEPADAFLDSIQAAFAVDGHPTPEQPMQFYDPNLTVIRAQGNEDDTAVLRERAGILTTAAAVIVDGDDQETYSQQLTVADSFGTRAMVVAVGEEGFRERLEGKLKRPVHRLEHCGPGCFAVQDRQALMVLQACREAAVRWVPNADTAEKYGWEIVEYADLRGQEPKELDGDMDTTPTEGDWTGLGVKDLLTCLSEVPDTRDPPSHRPDPPTRENLKKLQRAICKHVDALGKGERDWVGPVNLVIDATTRMLRPPGPGIHEGNKERALKALRGLCEAVQEVGVSVSKVTKDFSDKAVQSGANSSYVHVSVPEAIELVDAEFKRGLTLNLGGFYKDAFEASVGAWLMGLVTLAAVIEQEPENRSPPTRWKLGGSVLEAATTATLAATQGGQAPLAWRMVWAAMDLATVHVKPLPVEQGQPHGPRGRVMTGDYFARRPRALALGLRPDCRDILPVLLALPQALMALCGHEAVGDVPVYLLRATLFAAERQLKAYDMFLADVLEALGAARLRTAAGPRAVHQMREAAARLQSALRIREREEYNFSQAVAPRPPEEEPPPLPPPLAIPLASNCVHLAEYEIAIARFMRTRRFRRSLKLHKSYASAYLGAARRKLPKTVSSQHCLVRGLASGFFAMDYFDAEEEVFRRKPEWWGAADGGRASIGLDEAEHTLVKRLLLWPDRYKGLTLMRLIRRGGEAVVLEGRYIPEGAPAHATQRIAAKLPFQRETVKKEVEVRKKLSEVEAKRGGVPASASLAQVLQVYETPWPCMIMKYESESSDLLAVLRRDDGRPLRWCLRVLYELAAALAALHYHGVAHGDVAPRNVMVRADGTVCVIDMGLSKFVEGMPKADAAAAKADDVLGLGRIIRRMLQLCRAAAPLRALWERCVADQALERPLMWEVQEELENHAKGALGSRDDPCQFALPRTEEEEVRTQKIN